MLPTIKKSFSVADLLESGTPGTLLHTLDSPAKIQGGSELGINSRYHLEYCCL